MKKKLSIGIVDYDFLSSRKLSTYNFGALLLSSYYYRQGAKPRLVLSLKYDNLAKYDKIFIFKDYKKTAHPSNVIQRYNTLPIEEYGDGFPDKPCVPHIPEAMMLPLSTAIYEPVKKLILSRPGAFEIEGKLLRKQYSPEKLLYEHEGEVFKRRATRKTKLFILDDPLTFFTSKVGRSYLPKILDNAFAVVPKPLNISKVEPEYYDRIFNATSTKTLREKLYANVDDPYFSDLMNYLYGNEILYDFTLLIKTARGPVWVRKKGGLIYEKYHIEGSQRNGEPHLFMLYTDNENEELSWRMHCNVRHTPNEKRSSPIREQREKKLPNRRLLKQSEEVRRRVQAVRVGTYDSSCSTPKLVIRPFTGRYWR